MLFAFSLALPVASFPQNQNKQNNQTLGVSTEPSEEEVARAKALAYMKTHAEEIANEYFDYLVVRFMVEDNFYGRMPSQEEEFYGSLKGLVLSTGDPYSGFLTPLETKQEMEDMRGEFGGIGLKFFPYASFFQVEDVYKGSPADRAGLEKYDAIVAVASEDGKFTYLKNLSQSERLGRIRGKVGTKVKLRVYKYKLNKFVDVELVREKIAVQEDVLKWEVKDGVVVIKPPIFNDNVARDMLNAARDIDKKYPNLPIIVDLRENPGGFLGSCQIISSLWLKKDEKLMTSKSRSSTKNYYPNNTNSIAPDPRSDLIESHPPYLRQRRTVILVNGLTASASEVLTGALQEYEDRLLVKVVGERTFGKAVVQSLFHLNLDSKEGVSLLKITTQEWFTPGGRSINGYGIMPDVVVERTMKDIFSEKDPQMDAAIKLLKEWK